MIPIWQAENVRNALTYNGFTFNQYVGGSERDIVEVSRIVPQTMIVALHESREQADGLETYSAYKRGKNIAIFGIVRASTRGALYDRLEDFAAAVDPAAVSRDNPDTFGQLALDFNVPTADTANFPSGLMPCRFYCRAERPVEPPTSPVQGLAVPFVLPLLASDPRRYLQTPSSLTGGGAADNGIATYHSWPTLTISMTGAGSATFSIENEAADATLTLNLSSLVNTNSVEVSMESKTITVNGIDRPDLYVSGAFFTMEPGSNAINVLNSTNASPALTWRPAFSF